MGSRKASYVGGAGSRGNSTGVGHNKEVQKKLAQLQQEQSKAE